jgi:hypothetical protein
LNGRPNRQLVALDRFLAGPIRYLAQFLLLVGPATADAQVRPIATPPPPTSFASYGEPEPVRLSDITSNGQQYERVNVRTTGELRSLAGNTPYFVLADGISRVLLIPAIEGTRDTDLLVGRPIELTGVVRVLPAQQQSVPCYATRLPESKCLDPELPVLPNARQDWPPVSITFFSIVDTTPFGQKTVAPGGVSLLEIIHNPGPYGVKPITVVGVFAGRNLFGDLPAGSQRTPSDWVLKQGTNAVWVTAKLPQGRGWKLDPDYRGDTGKWLQVTGRVEAINGVTYLRATNVALASAPRSSDQEP